LADPVRIEGYREFTRLGAGGFATVYRAYQERFDRIVAVKVLNQTLDERALRRFERECQATGRLSGHPNVVTVLDSGLTSDGMAYMTTELMERGSLADWMDQHGAMPVADVLQIGVKMCGALTDVHEAGILHRDLKPPNILVSKYGEPALADFGISAVGFADATGNTTSFTPQHTPPEVLEGQSPAITMDVYSLGSTLYHLLNGAPAFDMAENEALLPFIMRVLNQDVPPLAPDVAPAEVSAVLARAMAKKADDRFQSAEDLGRALQGLQAMLGQQVTPMAATGPGTDSPSQGSIPSLLLPTFQPTLSPSTITATASTPRRAAIIAATAVIVIVALIGVAVAATRDNTDVNAGGPGGSPTTTRPLRNPAPPTDGGRLVVALGAEIDNLDPKQLSTSAALTLGSTIFEPLVRPRGDGFDPVLAETVPTANADFTVWTITVRPGVQFHDGTDLDANAAKAVLEAHRNGPARQNLKPIVAVEVVSDRSVNVSLTAPWPVFPATLSNLFVFSPANPEAQPPAGTGPFSLDSNALPSSATVKRNPNYWGPSKAHLDHIEFRLIASEQQRVTAFDRGEVNVLFTGNTNSIVHEQPRAAVIVQHDAVLDYLVLQTKNQPAIDPGIRQAISLAIDHEAFATADGNLRRATYSFLPVGSKWYPADPGAYPHDPEKAKQIVADYKATHGGGPVTLDVSTVANSDAAELYPLLRDQLKAVGIDLSFSAKEFRAVGVDLFAGKFQAGLASAPVPADPDVLNIFFHSQGDSIVPFNMSRYEDPAVDAALDTARTSPDDATRKAAVADLTQRLNSYGGYQFLDARSFALVADDTVTGLSDRLAENLLRGGSDPWCLALGIDR